MRALAVGTRGKVCYGAPPDDDIFAVWGDKWLGEQIIPPAYFSGRPFWYVDNGFWLPARGGATGYYSLTYRGLWPVLLERPDRRRLAGDLLPWRQPNPNGHILLALPSSSYGQMLGLDMGVWTSRIKGKIRKHTNRRIVVRERTSRRRIELDFDGAAVVVTHSSKVAVDAVKLGIPAIVEPTNPAAPVCGTDLNLIENPPMPDRSHWWASLMAQQFTISEMRDGTAKHWMDVIAKQTDRRGERNVA